MVLRRRRLRLRRLRRGIRFVRFGLFRGFEEDCLLVYVFVRALVSCILFLFRIVFVIDCGLVMRDIVLRSFLFVFFSLNLFFFFWEL